MRLSRQIETLFHAGIASGESDSQLVERFVLRRDEAAFAALVDRHGAMVLRVCRQVLSDEHDAQDASQATFLVLARRAHSIRRRESVASWLYGVALRVAAKARVASARRRAHERRGGAIAAAGHVIETDPAIEPERARWQWLHDALERLPESFRSPLVLCYLEGLTQEQAAAQLRCPIGTVQSRLARGREKLKARLARRDVDLSAVLPGLGFAVHQLATAPEAWNEATVRLATRLAQASLAQEATRATTVMLAEQVLRTMAFAKLKILVGITLVSAFVAAIVTLWVAREGPPGGHGAVFTQQPQGEQGFIAEQAPAKTPEPARTVKRLLRGIVRDDQGRPVAKAWVGSEVEPMLDVWKLVTAEDRIRVTQTPYRDAQGIVVAPGPLASYFEYRDDDGRWRALDPTDVRQANRSRFRPYLSRKDQEILAKAPEKTFLEVRLAKDRRRMIPLSSDSAVAARADAEGQFAVEATFSLPQNSAVYLHFASPDFRQEQAVVVRIQDPDHPLEVGLKPTRLVRAKFFQTPFDNEYRPLEWHVYAADATGGWGAWWGRAARFSGGADSSRRVELRLPEGRYRVLFRSSTIERSVDMTVPGGEEVVDLPDIRLESLAWIKMLGGPSAEIDVVDRDAHPVKLADFRGRVVLLTFVDGSYGEGKGIRQQLIALLKPLEKHPLTILVIHDASVTSLAKFREKRAPLIERQFAAWHGQIHVALDRAPAEAGAGPDRLRAGDLGSGRTAAAYELVDPACLIIDKNGRLAFALIEGEEKVESYWRVGEPGSLVMRSSDALAGEADEEKQRIDFAAAEIDRALREQLGLLHPADPDDLDLDLKPVEDYFWKPTVPKEGLIIRGRVVGPDGGGVAGALVSPILNQVREKQIKTLPGGAFSFTIDEAHSDLGIKVEAAGLASKTFWKLFRRQGTDQATMVGQPPSFVEPDGGINEPLRMGVGAVVTGRVVKGGKPVEGIRMIVQHPATVVVRERDSTPVRPLEDRETKTDTEGRFRIPFVSAELECSIFSAPGSLADHQTVPPRSFHSGRDGTTVDLGDFDVRPGRRVTGRVILADGKVPPLKAKLVVLPHFASELTCELDSNGRFEINGVPDGIVYVYVTQKIGIGIASDLPGYRLSTHNKCLDPTFPDRLQGMVNEDITDLTIQLDRGEAPEAAAMIPYGIDPARVADFEQAKNGPIAGVTLLNLQAE